jgi:tetratricopeptide (TPR) repeat protein
MTNPPVGGRFEIRRQLGAGGMGVVYEAFDHQRKQLVAIKKILCTDATAIYRLKKEFRSLADVAHPNLISLYELIQDAGEWFFTMELVHGKDFITHVRPSGIAWSRDEEDSTLLNTAPDPARNSDDQWTLTRAPDNPLDLPACPVRLPILRESLRQMAEGVGAVHRAGKLHRDLKPSNVLVTEQGRVVVLDFGVVADLNPGRDITFAGTPAYMSPEQIADQPATEASDWYSMGTILYEALTGRRPFSGSLVSLIDQKRNAEAAAPSSIVKDIPEDLDSLCVELLRRDPAARPAFADIIQRVGADRRIVVETPPPSGEVPFVGRAAELRALNDAAAAARSGQSVAVMVHGRSGLGKTSLVRHFIEELRQRDGSAVTLNGRCYEHESVPYKALDSLVDEIMQFLRKLKPLEVKALLPTDASALSRLFPVLDDIDALKKARLKAEAIVDSNEIRRRAFAALREMMARIADEHELVIFLDDLQWGDRDSAQLIGELLRPPHAPALLLIGTYRSEEASTSAFLSELRRLRDGEIVADVREIAIEELPAEDAKDLARAVAGPRATPARVEAIARESAGSPLFIQELARFASDEGDSGTTSLDDVIRVRVRRLAEPARQLLEVVAIAGQPVGVEPAKQAAGIEGDAHPVVAELRAENLIRTRFSDGEEEIVTYHDRVREAIVEQLDASARKEWHLRLAFALEQSGCDVEVLATHFDRAGEPQRAAAYAFEAADKAAAALAFDHAARLYRFAIDVCGRDQVSVERVIQLADCLGNAGRGAEAAQYYLDAVDSVEPARALEMRRRASEHLLRSGHVDEGLRVMREVLATVGMKMPETPRQAKLGIIARRLLLLLRGITYKERPESELSPMDIMRVDVCWAATIGLVFIDNIRASYFQTIHMLTALRLGEPHRAARALAVEAGLSSVSGGRRNRRTEKLLAKADREARRLANPHTEGMTLLAHMSSDFYLGRFRTALRYSEEAESLFRERCTAATWEIDTARNVGMAARCYLGRVNELAEHVPPLFQAAQQRGDRYAATELVVGRPTILWLAWDAPDTARELVDSLMSEWYVSSFYIHVQHFKAMVSRTVIDLYRGDPRSAMQHLENGWPNFVRSMSLRIQVVRVEAYHLRARCALAGGDFKAARQDADRIFRERMSWALPLAEAIRGGICAATGETEHSREWYERAARNFEKADMSLFAAAARRRLGEMTGGETGRALIEGADEWMRAQGIKVPERMAHVLTP